MNASSDAAITIGNYVVVVYSRKTFKFFFLTPRFPPHTSTQANRQDEKSKREGEDNNEKK